MTVREAKLLGKSKLTSSPSPALDTECFLTAILKRDKTHLLFHPEENLNDEQQELFLNYIRKRCTGLPVAYILGHKEFYGYDFAVNPSVLIPKPDTEILVEKAIEILKQKISQNSKGSQITILDMCTGSGCVGISILKAALEENLFEADKAPFLEMADISPQALELAQQNANQLLGSMAQKISFTKTNLFENIKGNFDIIVSNPPYIPAAEARELLEDGRSEPILALDGDVDLEGKATGQNDGLGIMRNLVPQATKHLKSGGALLCESGEYNALLTKSIFEENGFTSTQIFCDLEGQLRVTQGTLP